MDAANVGKKKKKNLLMEMFTTEDDTFDVGV